MEKLRKIKFRYIIGLITISMVFGFYSFDNYLNQKLTQQNDKILENVLIQKLNSFDIKINSDKNTIKIIAESISNIPYDKENITLLLDKYSNKTSFDYLSYVSLEGNLFNSKGLETNISHREYFQKALAGETVITDPFLSKLNNDKVIVMASPVYKEGKVIAVITGTYLSKTLNTFLDGGFQEEIYTFVTTNSGDIIAKSTNYYSIVDSNNVFSAWEDAEFYFEDNLDNIKNNTQENIGGHTRYNLKGNDRYMYYASIETNGWNVFAIAPKDVVIKTSNEILFSVTLLVLFIGIFVMIIVAYNYYIQNKYIKKLDEIAFVSELTNAPTLAKFKFDAPNIIKENSKLNYMMVKLDVTGFRIINEVLGHDAGNDILKIIAKTIKLVLNEKYETYAHLNSDTYIILVSYKDIEDFKSKRFKFHEVVRNEVREKHSINIEMPEGSTMVNKSEDIMVAFERVNFAHRRAKIEKIPFCDFDEEYVKNDVYIKLIENKMEAALENEEFKMFLQPKYSLKDETIVGAEALVRWKREGEEISYPGDFIPIFEKNGFISKLDMYMFDNACKTIKDLIDDEKPPITISVNFSRYHLDNEKFVSQLCDITKKYGVPNKYLEIEITETVMYDNVEILGKVISNLHKVGFTISMDDFGTGYSSLGLLKNIPVDIIKIDKSFLENIDKNPRAVAVIKSVMEMAKHLKIKTVAEGVETIENVNLLRDLGCDMVQGYYYAKPMPLEDFKKLYLKSL